MLQLSPIQTIPLQDSHVIQNILNLPCPRINTNMPYRHTNSLRDGKTRCPICERHPTLSNRPYCTFCMMAETAFLDLVRRRMHENPTRSELWAVNTLQEEFDKLQDQSLAMNHPTTSMPWLVHRRVGRISLGRLSFDLCEVRHKSKQRKKQYI